MKKNQFFRTNNYQFFTFLILLICILFACRKSSRTSIPGVLDLPNVSTLEVKNIIINSGKVIEKVFNDASKPISERGFCWDTNLNHTIQKNYLVATGALTSESFTTTLSGLQDSTVYYVRAYAKNYSGLGYGSELKLITKMLYSNVLHNQIVRIDIQSKKQIFMGARASFDLYQNEWLSMSRANRDSAAKWMAKDINLKYSKTYIIDLPKTESVRYDTFAQQVADIRKYNLNITTQVAVNNLPNHLELKDANSVEVRGAFYPNITGITIL